MNRLNRINASILNFLAFVFLLFIMSGCASTPPTKEKYQDAEEMYKTGQLTAQEYEAAKQKIALDAIKQARAKEEADARNALDPRNER